MSYYLGTGGVEPDLLAMKNKGMTVSQHNIALVPHLGGGQFLPCKSLFLNCRTQS